MPTLTIRNLPDAQYKRLRRRATANKRSMEAEARAIMDQALTPQGFAEPGADWIAELQEFVAKQSKPRKSKESATDAFIRERRAMWGEE